MEDGTPYKSKHTFTCMAQVDGFKRLFEEIAARPQDYVSERGRLTTNSVEGFHGLALLYRDKKTDLGHVHYTCKTNMSICHKVRPYTSYTGLTGVYRAQGTSYLYTSYTGLTGVYRAQGTSYLYTSYTGLTGVYRAQGTSYLYTSYTGLTGVYRAGNLLESLVKMGVVSFKWVSPVCIVTKKHYRKYDSSQGFIQG